METCGDEWSGYGRSVKRETEGTCAYSPTSFGMIDGIILSGNLGGFLMVCNLTTTRNHMRPRDVLLGIPYLRSAFCSFYIMRSSCAYSTHTHTDMHE